VRLGKGPLKEGPFAIAPPPRWAHHAWGYAQVVVRSCLVGGGPAVCLRQVYAGWCGQAGPVWLRVSGPVLLAGSHSGRHGGTRARLSERRGPGFRNGEDPAFGTARTRLSGRYWTALSFSFERPGFRPGLVGGPPCAPRRRTPAPVMQRLICAFAGGAPHMPPPPTVRSAAGCGSPLGVRRVRTPELNARRLVPRLSAFALSRGAGAPPPPARHPPPPRAAASLPALPAARIVRCRSLVFRQAGRTAHGLVETYRRPSGGFAARRAPPSPALMR
jgi:hypothetical protein